MTCLGMVRDGLALTGLIMIVVLLVTAPVLAGEWTINPGDSIQTAINNATDNDTILLNSGTYYQNGITIAKNITLRGNPATNSDRINTFIDGNNAQPRIFTCSGPVTLTIDRLTLQNGKSADGTDGTTSTAGNPGGSGGAVYSEGAVIVTSSSFYNFTTGNGGHGGKEGTYPAGPGGAGGDGGAISSRGNVTVTASQFVNCSTGDGGTGGDSSTGSGVGIGGKGGRGGAVFSAKLIDIRGTTFRNCRAGNGGSGGGGFMGTGSTGGAGGDGGAIASTDIVIADTTVITDCHAGSGGRGGDDLGTGGAGGGGGAINSMVNLTLTNSTITGCTAGTGGLGSPSGGYGGNGGDGGAIFASNISYTTMDFSTISGCSAGDGGASGTNGGGMGGDGGAIASTYPAIITSSTISGNSAGSGAGVAGSPDSYTCFGGNGGGVYGGFMGDVTTINSTFSNNNAGDGASGFVGGKGGAIYVDSSSGNSPATIEASTFTGNSAGNSVCGGAIYSRLWIYLNSSTLTGNTASSGSATCSWYGELKYNRIYNNLVGSAVANEGPVTGSNQIDAHNNWWGTNSNPSGFTQGKVTSSPWLMLCATALQPITTVQTSVVHANLTYNSAGVDTSAGGHIPDDLALTYALTGSGSISSVSGLLKNGANSTLYVPDIPGTATIDIATDSQTVPVQITVTLPPPPDVTDVVPPEGITAGGTNVSLTGTNFLGATGVWFDAIPVTNLTVNSDTNITLTSPSHIAGTVNITITTPGGTNANTSASRFAYVAPRPEISGLTPVIGPVSGGTNVTLTGTGFFGATEVLFGITSATNISVNSDTNITATAPSHAAGYTNVTVTTAGGTSVPSSTSRFYYSPVPAVSGVSPFSGPAAGGTAVTLTGTGFFGATEVLFDGTVGSGLTVDSETQLVVTSPPHAVGMSNVSVITPGGTSGPSAGSRFYYAPVPEVTGISPGSGLTAGGTVVIVTGTGFINATAVRFGSINASNLTVESDTLITVTSPSQAAATVHVTVTTPGGTSSGTVADQFLYIAPVPAVTQLSPAIGPPEGGTTVIITGTGFTAATDVRFNATAATSYTVDSDSQITVVNPPGEEGDANVNVTTAGGTSPSTPESIFRYVPLPVITSLSPTEGPETGGTVVTITGSRFTGATSVLFNTTPGTGLVVDSDTQVRITTPACTRGMVNVTVTTPKGSSSPSAASWFTFTAVGSPAQEIPNGDDTTPVIVQPVMVSTVNVGGNSVVGRVTVTGTGLSDLVVTGMRLDDAGEIPGQPPGIVYQYFTLVPLRYASISNTVITFSVPTAWMNENHFTEQDIVLCHYSQNVWVELPTTSVKTDGDRVTFTAQSPGFSLFAITGRMTPVSTVTETPHVKTFGELAGSTPVSTTVTTVRHTPTLQPTPDKTIPAAVSHEPGFPVVTVLLIGTGCILFAGICWFIRLWWIRRQNPALFRKYD